MSEQNEDDRTVTEIIAPPDNAVLDVLIIGAGFAGILMAIKLIEKGQRNIRLVEKADGVGGTWWHTRYPGVTCDTPARLYCYSFEPYAQWSARYAPGSEIQQYLAHCVDKYGLRPFVELGRKVARCEMNDNTGLWQTHFADGSMIRSHHVVNATGMLHEPKYPDIPGIDDFAGPAMHTARWQRDVPFTGKRVAVIGSGASAVGVIPQLAELAGQVIVFQRSANYVMPRENKAYSAGNRKRAERFAFLERREREAAFSDGEKRMAIVTKDNKLAKRTDEARKRMAAQVTDPALKAAVQPDYPVGCKQILLSDDYFTALEQDNVTLLASAATAIQAGGVVDAAGTLHEVDVIVYATGYDVDAHMTSIEVIGPKGKQLTDLWRNGAEAYRGAFVAGFPNYYLMGGPNSVIPTNSFVAVLESQISCLLDVMQQAGIDRWIGASERAQKRWNARLQRDLLKRVWGDGPVSWYKRADGRMLTLYPNDARTWDKEMLSIDWDDFETSFKRANIG